MIWDLHIHTSMSDGTMAPREVVNYANKKGVGTLAITDHDCISGVADAKDEGEKCGIRVIPGIELSIETSREIHILGYNIDFKNDELNNSLLNLQQSREGRVKKIVDKLKLKGINISLDDIYGYSMGKSVGRLHIAKVLKDKGYADSIDDAFNKYLKVGALAYVPRQRLTSKQAIDMIKSSGGFACLAHPLLFGSGIRRLVKNLTEMGITAIEAYYPSHNKQMTEFYVSLAKKSGLFVTCGSDFHGVNRVGFDIGSTYKEDNYLLKSLDELFEKS
ncbi:MAG: PHP domain-containing protein [Eubacteriales bacterium]